MRLVDCDDVEAAQRELPALVARLGLALRRFERRRADLEDVFVDLVGEATPMSGFVAFLRKELRETVQHLAHLGAARRSCSSRR